ncbi:glycosyltransferase family 2 protein [Fodinibius salsisoli]|uniref:Glycosyltransferase family 2 protein n=1 Tax=Fodinibius salsisoli TaxID=2820877 RepID=A0ABT3PJC6_9BACT|nr:glycosyltransferase family 2 protein [Fodinibius salsisoli]MCW9706041.1 glycosyltransferase family 2 protein [Fodinibius salsisoli]
MNISLTPRIFIILVNWNGWQDTIECLHSLDNLDYPNYSVIVVDNGSTDGSPEKISRAFPQVHLIESDQNLGFAGGNNLGIEQALNEGTDYVWLLNNDTVVDPDALSHLVQRMEKDTNIGICGSKLIYYHQRDTIQVLGGGSHNKWLATTNNFGQHQSVETSFNPQQIEENLDFVIGASMLVSRRFLNEVGWLSEDYFLYYEELDWGIRAKPQFSLGFAPESVVYHKEGASTGGNQLQRANRSEKSDYYQLKNRLKFTYKFFPLYLPCAYLSIFYALINRVRRGQWKRIPMIIKLMFTFNK